MTKKTKKLLLLFGIFLLLLGILFGIQVGDKRQEQKAAEEKEAAKIYVTDLKNVSEVRYDVGNGEFGFAKQNDKWIFTEDSDFPLKQSVPEQIIDTFGKLEAQRELKDGDSLEAYGLKNPSYTVCLTTTDGTQTTLQFGNAVDDSYYLTVEGTDRVYTVASGVLDELQYTMDELAQFDTYPEIGSGNLLKETITENGKTTTYDSEKEEDAENIAAVAGGLGAVKLDTAAEYSVSDEDLPKFGLDEKARITVEVTYKANDIEDAMTLYIGNTNGSDKRYVMINDSRIVYLISDEVCKNILNVDDATE